MKIFLIFFVSTCVVCLSLEKDLGSCSSLLPQEQEPREGLDRQQRLEQQQDGEQKKIVKGLKKWIETIKNPNLEFPVFEDGCNQKEQHWIGSCSDGTLSKGLIKNEAGKLEGKGELTFDKSSECFDKFKVSKVVGTFAGGLLEGTASIHFKNQSFFIAPFCQGSVSGLARTFMCQFGFCDYEGDSEKFWNTPEWLSEVTTFIILII